VSEPVVFHTGAERIEGWTLNVSRGGLRAVVEDDVSVGAELEVTIGESETRRPVRVVWAREQRGGAVIGLLFLDEHGFEPPPTPSTAPDPPDEQPAVVDIALAPALPKKS
jgi:hypothetical protein